MKRRAALGCLVALAGCSGSFFTSRTPPQSIYQLSARGAASGAEMPVDLAVLKPRLRTGLGTDRIAALYGDRRLDYFANARWSGPLEDVIQDLALQAFRERVHLRTVSTDRSAFASGHWLELDVVDFQAEYAGASGAAGDAPPTVHVHIIGRVGSSGERRVLGRFEADEHQAAAENRLTAIVEAFNQAADRALAKGVADTLQALDASTTLHP